MSTAVAVTHEQWDRVKDLLATARDLPAEARDAFLVQESSGDEVVLAEVRSLLTYDSLPTDDKVELGPGTVLKGRYRILHKLGEGGFATTFLAVDTLLSERKVVIKVLTDPDGDPYIQRKFGEELQALSILEHPNVIAPLDHGVLADGQAFLVTQFAEGRTLRSLFEDGPLSLFRTGELMQQAGRALSFVHAQGVLHRDLKPENIVVQTFADGSDHLRLIDFGIATVPRSTPATTTQIIGSLAYMAPEQLLGRPIAASDLYSLGVLAYEALTGRVPFSSDSPQMHLGLQHGPIANPVTLRPEIPPAAGALILEALSLKPEDRPPDVGRFGDALKAALSRKIQPERQPRRSFAFAAVLVFFLVCLGSGFRAVSLRTRNSHVDRAAVPALPPSPGAAVNPPLLTVAFLDAGSSPMSQLGEGVVIAPTSDFRLAVRASQPAHVYLFSATNGSDSLHMLFPSSTSYGGSSALDAQQTRLIPEKSSFRVSGDSARGSPDEIVYIAVSATPEPQFESALRWSNPHDRGEIADPGARDAVRRSLQAHTVAPAWHGSEASLSMRDGGLVVTQVRLKHD